MIRVEEGPEGLYIVDEGGQIVTIEHSDDAALIARRMVLLLKLREEKKLLEEVNMSLHMKGLGERRYKWSREQDGNFFVPRIIVRKKN